MGPRGHVTCLDSKTGEFKWMLNLVSEYGTKIPQWYTAQCPLIDDGKAILAPAGGEVLMMGLDCETGETVWQTPNPDKWVMTHSSIIPMEFAGRRFYVYCGGSTDAGGVVGVSAADGQVLWKTDAWKIRTNVPMPVIVGPDRVFLSAGYGQYDFGCTMLRLTESEGRIAVTSEFLHPTSVFGSMQHTPIFYEGHIYGVGMDKQLVCLDLEGRVVWTSTSANTFGSGPYVIADGLLYVLDDSGVLTLVEPSPAGYSPLARARVMDGFECWGPMAIASGRLIVRDLNRMVCLDVAQK
jgi:outer membrane protein assembly factor BamB